MATASRLQQQHSQMGILPSPPFAQQQQSSSHQQSGNQQQSQQQFFQFQQQFNQPQQQQSNMQQQQQMMAQHDQQQHSIQQHGMQQQRSQSVDMMDQDSAKDWEPTPLSQLQVQASPMSTCSVSTSTNVPAKGTLPNFALSDRPPAPRRVASMPTPTAPTAASWRFVPVCRPRPLPPARHRRVCSQSRGRACRE